MVTPSRRSRLSRLPCVFGALLLTIVASDAISSDQIEFRGFYAPGFFAELLDAERVLFQARLTERRLQADHAIALADLDRALGRLPRSEGESR